ncbi:hypothetical protein ES705_47176 [subsurface metagenome]
MNINNPSIVLIAIYTQRDDQDIATFRQLQDIVEVGPEMYGKMRSPRKVENLEF